MEAVSQIAVLFLALCGMIEIVRLLLWKLILPKESEQRAPILILPLSGHQEDVEYIVRAAAMRAEWAYQDRIRVTVVDCGMDEDTRSLCDRVCRQISGVTLQSHDEFERRLARVYES